MEEYSFRAGNFTIHSILGCLGLEREFEEWKSPVFTQSNPYDWETEEFLNWPEKHHDYTHLDTKFYKGEELGP